MLSIRNATLLVLATATVGLPGMANAQPLRRDLGSYFIFAQRNVQGKDLQLQSGCNIGVNCAKPTQNSTCGTASFEAIFAKDGSQIAADDVNFSQPGASIGQLFTNGTFNANNVTVRTPPVQPLDPKPIIAGTCGPACTPTPGSLEALCGFPAAFPACNPANTVLVQPGLDCIGGVDTTPGDNRCNLAPGTYGDIVVKDNGQLDMTAGDYNICSILVGKNANVNGSASVLNISVPGAQHRKVMQVGNTSVLGGQCGDFTVRISGPGDVQYGKSAKIAAKVCGPQSDMNLGHGNTLKGQFIGDDVNLDRGNTGECCGGGCTCIDSFSPSSAKVGATITLNSQCDLNAATSVKICGIDAPIVTKTTNVVTVTVPAGANGACMVEVFSAAGVFKSLGTLTVTP